MKTLFTTLLIITTLISIQAQLSLGLEGGTNASNVKLENFDFYEKSKPRVGYYFALVPKYTFGNRWSFLSGIQYSTKGFVSEIDQSSKLSYRNTYLDILPQLEYKASENLGLSLGANMGINLQEAYRINDESHVRLSQYGLHNSTDWGLVLGARLYMKKLFLHFNYNHGLRNISNLEFTDFLGGTTQKNRNFQLGIGYFLGLDKN